MFFPLNYRSIDTNADAGNPSRCTPCREGESLIGPAGHAANRVLHGPPKASQTQRSLVAAIAIRPGALHRDDDVRRPFAQPLLGDLEA